MTLPQEISDKLKTLDLINYTKDITISRGIYIRQWDIKAVYYIGKKSHANYFSITKYGIETAIELAINWRNEQLIAVEPVKQDIIDNKKSQIKINGNNIPRKTKVNDYVYYSIDSKTGLKWKCDVYDGQSLLYTKDSDAGKLNGNYYRVAFTGNLQKNQRIIYELHYGELNDKNVVYFVNKIPTDFRIENLTLVRDIKDRTPCIEPKKLFGVGINNRMKPTCGIGQRPHMVWRNMITRCYSEERHTKFPAYSDCTVSDNFKNYEYFYDWYQQNYKSYYDNWDLDKDILIKGNKLYSENTCCFVPPEINGLLTKNDICRGLYPIGVYYNNKKCKYTASCSNKYKKAFIGDFNTPEEAFFAYKIFKEEHIKFIADKYKAVIDSRVYKALYNYQVEITD